MNSPATPGAECILACHLHVHASSNGGCSPAIISHDGTVFGTNDHRDTTDQGGFISRTGRVILPTHMHGNVQMQGRAGRGDPIVTNKIADHPTIPAVRHA